MKSTHNKPGFIIPLTLMLVAIAMVLITGIYQKGSIFVPFISTMMQRQQAKMLALSGVQVAMSQLATASEEQDKQAAAAKPASFGTMLRGGSVSAAKQEQTFLSELLPILNQWQTFKLKKDTDGIDGEMMIAIASEDGKIDLNGIYDFSKKRFRGENAKRGDWKKIMQSFFMKIRNNMNISANLFEQFEKFLKERQYRVNDATELLNLDAFKPFSGKEFYTPVQKLQAKDRSLFLLDIFTANTGKSTVQPWLLSNSMRTILDMKLAPSGDIQQRKTMVQGWIKNFKSAVNWSTDWNRIFQPIYGIEYQRLLKGIDAVFETSFDPKLFSVVSYGVVGQVTQRAYAIVERIRKTVKNKTLYDVKIKKFYWI